MTLRRDTADMIKILGLVSFILAWIVVMPGGGSSTALGSREVSLPTPAYKGKVSVEEALKSRRTHRSFKSNPLSSKQFSQILWAAYGVTSTVSGLHLKTAPSAGALYPLDIYAVVGEGGVGTMASGVYYYIPGSHSVKLIKEGDLRQRVAAGCLHQMWMAEAPLLVVVTGAYARSTGKYGARGVVYTHIEAGCVGQNIFLQVEAMGLKAGIVGAFDSEQLIETLGISGDLEPLLVMPVGYPD